MTNSPDAYESLIEFSKNHYENFPVVSVLVKRSLRKHVAAVYWFARMSDDIADEGDIAPDVRVERLDSFERDFLSSLKGEYVNLYFNALAQTVKEKELTVENFLKLLRAFRQDTRKNRYESFEELKDYCSNSADPVGRIILELYGYRDEQMVSYSDSICSALQLTNFFQDVSIDYKKNRIYIPIRDIAAFHLNPDEFLYLASSGRADNRFTELMKFQTDRAEKMFDHGEKLLGHLSGRLKMEIKWTILGGRGILRKIKGQGYDTLSLRPKLTKTDFMRLFVRSLL